MSPYRPPSIRNQGLAVYLDSKRGEHNDFGYKEFQKLVTAGVNTSNLSRAFSVSRQTIEKWVAIYKEEQSIPVA